MTYYIFKASCDTEETGPIYPQIQKWKPRYDDNKPDSYYSYYSAAKGGVFPDFAPDLDSLVMDNRSKPTDFISSMISIGFIISQKLKSLLEQFKFPPHRFYPAKIIYKKNELGPYYFMHIITNQFIDYLDFVDYNKSVFFTGGFAKDNPEYITLTSKPDYLDKSKQLQVDFSVKKFYRAIYAERIYFNSGFDKSLDCFNAPFGTNYYISQRLRTELIENKITGCDIQLTNKIII